MGKIMLNGINYSAANNSNPTPESIGALALKGGGEIYNDDKGLSITPFGLQGDDSQTLSGFYQVDTHKIVTREIIYGNTNIDERYLRVDGGTMQNNAIINMTGDTGIGTGINLRTNDNQYQSQYTPAEISMSSSTGFDNDKKKVTISPNLVRTSNINDFEEADYQIELKDNRMKIVDNTTSDTTLYNTNSIQCRNNYEISVKKSSTNKDIGINISTVNDAHCLSPVTDNLINLGLSGYRWKNIYAVNGTIQTSDRTKKANIKALDTDKAKDFIMGLKPSSYNMIEGTSGRTHYGLIAQDIEELMEQLGILSTEFAGFIKSPRVRMRYTDENGKQLKESVEEIIEGEYDYGLRYEEFIAPLITVVQEQQREIKELKEIIYTKYL